ncbi:MAG: helix-turn-helix domain-containing protein [Oscillospiraceae bacterium]|nr:helix-turn-helix domain-containing protein [Oscillospiraceae bacterium]
MSRIPETEKILAVKAYLQGEGTTHSQATRLGVAESTFREWVTKYKTFGESGLRSSTKRMQYAAETKNAAVTAYLSGRGSQKEICEQYKIKDKKTLREWIEVYNGHKELRPNEGRGSDIYMTKGRKTTYEERVEIVSYQQIYSWVRKYNEKGAEGLLDKRGKRKSESEMTELEKLRAENRMLEARNKRLEMENAVLKKLEEIERRCP